MVDENHDSCFSMIWFHFRVLLNCNTSHGWDRAGRTGFTGLLVMFLVDEFIDVMI